MGLKAFEKRPLMRFGKAYKGIIDSLESGVGNTEYMYPEVTETLLILELPALAALLHLVLPLLGLGWLNHEAL